MGISIITVHLESNTTIIFSELPHMDHFTIGNFNEKDFLVSTVPAVYKQVYDETL